MLIDGIYWIKIIFEQVMGQKAPMHIFGHAFLAARWNFDFNSNFISKTYFRNFKHIIQYIPICTELCAAGTGESMSCK